MSTLSSKARAFAGVFLFILSLNASASDDPSGKALKQITDAAAQICARAATGGTSETASASASVKADVDQLVRKLADLGIKGNFAYTREQHEGVLSDQVLAAAHEANQCKLEVFKVLSDRLLRPTTTENQTTRGPNSPAIGTMSGGTVNVHGN